MNFETAREKDLYMKDKEKAYYLDRAILDLLKSEGASISETRYLFRNVVEQLEDAPVSKDVTFLKPYL
ncbi:hypothetical protein [Eshraghiella crossota]|uniref:hypothetical protein n=1 Tax=Eshraghiella crossota TaxID=45851 RepID=UPI004029411F